MRFVFLSHILTKSTIGYRGEKSIAIDKYASIKNGESTNSYKFSMSNHLGTHVDAPNHFFEKGYKITQYHPGAWFFKSPQVIVSKLGPSEVLRCGKWVNEINKNTDILLFKSNWAKVRKKKAFLFENPGIHPEVGLFLRKNYPKIRAIGIDWISISTYKDRELGRMAHKVFLDPNGENDPILIIEDLNLSYSLALLKEVFIFPLLIEDMDSAPCTAIGKIL